MSECEDDMVRDRKQDWDNSMAIALIKVWAEELFECCASEQANPKAILIFAEAWFKRLEKLLGVRPNE